MQKRSSPVWLGLGALAAAGVGYGLYRRAQAAKQVGDLRRLPLRDVDSSMIRQLGYRPETKEMVVRFNTGRKYAYQDVPRRAFEDLLEAESIGKHFNDKMRDRYTHEKIAVSLRVPGFRLRAPKPAGAPSATPPVTGQAPQPTATTTTSAQQPMQPAPQATPPGTTPAQPPPPQPPPPQPTSTATGPVDAPAPSQGAPQPQTTTPQTGAAKPEAEQSSFLYRNSLAIGGGVVGAGVGATMKGSDGRPLGLEGAMVGAMTGVGAGALLKSVLTAGNKVTPAAKATVEKTGSVLSGVLATGVGAGVGAVAAGEGNRLQGALIGGATGLVAGQAMRHLPSHTGSLADATTGKVTPAMQAKLKQQQANLATHLKDVKGTFSRHQAIESFMKNPVNAELSQVYRSQQRGQLAGAAGGGLIGGMAVAYTSQPEQQKSAALRAVRRFNGIPTS